MNIANSSSSVYESDYPDEHEELPTERHRRKIRVKHVDDGSMSRNIHIRHSPYRLLPQKRKREADESETSLPQKRTRWAPFPESSSSESDSGSSKSCSDSDCSCSDSDCVSMTDSDEDEGREIDLRYEASPCPGGCPCRPGYRPFPVVHGIERLKPVTVPLYKRFLQYKLLNIFNTCFNQCCDCMCQRRWTQRDRRSLRRIMADY
ncbi:hypothetical protein DPMN_090646 [Dreissena polymorpha]|uniref:Uncharacterized protein n=2 Tax=Dreissena polymorpha TaxID=45954 RepID=A0A9D4KY42_DREPO|nr:hypothetical protein DPMN_090646 [Dreissena polymorpha]